MIKNFLLVCIAIIPVLFLLKLAFDKDKIEKEPFLLLLRLFIAGIISAAIVLSVSKSLRMLIHIDSNFYNSFVKIAFVEEICKWICIYIITWKNKEFNYKFDAIVYSIFASLGFALIENIGYAFSYGLTTCLLRAIISVPCHTFFAIYMGYYLGIAKVYYIHKNYKNGSIYTLYSLFVPTALHGIYDYCLIGGNDGFYVLFIMFIISLYIFSVKTLNTSSDMDMALDQK